jgi:hypothetical protein
MSEAAGNDESLEPVPFILMRADETFDGQERVPSPSATRLRQLGARGRLRSSAGALPAIAPRRLARRCG